MKGWSNVLHRKTTQPDESPVLELHTEQGLLLKCWQGNQCDINVMYCIKLFCTSNMDSMEKKTHRIPVQDEDDALNARKQSVNISTKFTISWAHLRDQLVLPQERTVCQLGTVNVTIMMGGRLSLIPCREDINGIYFQVFWAVLLWPSCPGCISPIPLGTRLQRPIELIPWK